MTTEPLHERIAVLAHGRFPDDARAAIALVRYGRPEVVAVIDTARRSPLASQLVRTLPKIPIVRRFDDVDEPVDALYVGIDLARDGTTADLTEPVRRDVRAALAAGRDVVVSRAGFPVDDPEFARLTADGDGRIVDVGAPPADRTDGAGRADAVDATVLLTVGTDRYVGASSTAFELVRAARERGLDAALVPTSHVGALLEGRGVTLDRVPTGRAHGVVDGLVRDRSERHELLVVEGQGALCHPGSSGQICGLLHAARPNGLVLCHSAGRELTHGFDVDLPPVPAQVDLYERLAAPVSEATVLAGALNTMNVATPPEAREAVADFAELLGAPATDPVRFDADALLEAVDLG
ncbi:DUF1611 domain-containing protein [Halorubrum sp. AD140]|uniref:DUF1611 domain-containing protein n=1 Tax=Halorubrum sp. AD140 TaxID=3050073 RepID=UPI002ACCE366|nr:DUF1611 domain-containing protein [Halorubrum sp. AD140]MDZ5809979.1 DUF1611 domain-containing protein [Halorubrum sp. AD140]